MHHFSIFGLGAVAIRSEMFGRAVQQLNISATLQALLNPDNLSDVDMIQRKLSVRCCRPSPPWMLLA